MHSKTSMCKQITRVFLFPLICGQASLCSSVIKIQRVYKCLLSYLGEAPRGSLTGWRLSKSRAGERRGVHANVATVLIKRAASQSPSDGLTDVDAPLRAGVFESRTGIRGKRKEYEPKGDGKERNALTEKDK